LGGRACPKTLQPWRPRLSGTRPPPPPGPATPTAQSAQETLCCPCRRVRDGGGGGPLRGQGLGADPGRRGPGVAVGRRGGRASSSTCSPPRFDIVARCHVRRRCFGPNPCSASCFVPLLRDSRNPELMHAWVLLGNCCYSSSTELRLHSIRIVEMLYKASCTCGHIIYKYFRNFG
jgi:hypothetical protein